MEFNTIETQEQLDGIIKDRLDRQTTKHNAEMQEKEKELQTVSEENANFKKQLEAMTEKMKNHETELAERDKKIADYETNSAKMRIANENGLPLEAVEFLNGTNEEEIKASAEKLKALYGTNNRTHYVRSEKDGVKSDSSSEIYREMARALVSE